METTKWYLARLIYKIRLSENNIRAQYDEQIRLVKATNTNEALIKSLRMGYENEINFKNHKHNTVNWEFIDVMEIISIPNLEDGLEIYSSTHEPKNQFQFEKMIHDRAKMLVV